ncbi:MAG TPA: hypothetical protein VMF14_22395 [Solirubrobacteraceae bacterium]|nr:hypothetical protein [Solirubrobacteraceae bacterium]
MSAPDARSPAARFGAGALVWSAGLLVAALVWPAYSTSASSGDGVTLGHATLVQANGARALVLMAIPVVVSAGVLGAIWARGAGARWAGPVAWAGIALLAAEALVGIATIGLFIAPVPILLAIGVRRAAEAGRSPRAPVSAG